MNQPQHPDALSNYAKMKEITRGGSQAVEDQALKAYQEEYEKGNKDKAAQQYFETFTKFYNGNINNHNSSL